MKQRHATVSHFHCSKCRSTTPLPRYRPRERGHVKDLWCYQCKETTKHLEERYNDYGRVNMYYTLAKTQRKLNNSIYRKHNVHPEEVYEKQKIALLVELGELANEINFFKYWKANPEPNYNVPCETCKGVGYLGDSECVFCVDGRDESKNPVLEEYVDVLHFLLTATINRFKDDDLLMSQFLAQPEPLSYPDLEGQFGALYYEISNNLSANLDLIWRYFLGLGEMLGFPDEVVEDAYYEKNKENFARQERGY